MCDCCLLHHYQRLEMLYLITYYYFMIRQHRRRRKRWRHTDEVGKKRNETHTHKAAQQQTFNHIIYDFHRFHHYIMLKSGLYIYIQSCFLRIQSLVLVVFVSLLLVIIYYSLSLFFSLSSLFSIKLYIYLLL